MTSRYDHYTTHHTSRRTVDWDYTQPAAYFVTICTADRVHLFGTVEEGRMSLNVPGRIAAEEWQRSETIRDRVHLDAFVVMPNHLHGIVVFADPVVDAPTCPREYRLFGGGESGDRLQESRSEASTGGSTLSGENSDALNESNPGGKPADERPRGPAPRSLGSFVAGFKSAATTSINDHRGTPGAPVWQRNYHDRIIQNERQWQNTRAYIRRNPAKWHADRLHRPLDP